MELRPRTSDTEYAYEGTSHHGKGTLHRETGVSVSSPDPILPGHLGSKSTHIQLVG